MKVPEMMFTTLPTRTIACLGMVLVVVLGCKDSAKKQDAVVQGTVTLDGELVGQGIVTFHPDSNGPVAYGTILKDGTYALRIGRGVNDDRNNKIHAGSYTATVAVTTSSPSTQSTDGSPPKPGPRITDAKFSNKTTSELKYDIVSGRNIINISVDRAPPEAEAIEEESGEPASTEEAAATEQEPTSPAQEEAEGSNNAPKQPQSDEEASTDAIEEETAQ